MKLETVLQKLKDANLCLKPSKCTLCKTEVTSLGHTISREGVATDQAKDDKVENWPQPKLSQELQQFLGLASYYCKLNSSKILCQLPDHSIVSLKRAGHSS